MSYSKKSVPMNQNLKMIPCSNCGELMPELRLTKFGYSFCVKCSEAGLGAGKKSGVPIMMGEGDHTWIQTVIMDENEYRNYQNQLKAEKNLEKANKAEVLDFDKEDKKTLFGPVQIKEVEPKK